MASSLHSQRIAVTGASGFIGLHLLKGLHRAGARVVAILSADKPAGALDAMGFAVERIVVDDIGNMGEAIRSAEPDFVVHLSAFVSTARTLQSLEQTMRWNLLSTISVLTACTEMKVKRTILMGSTEEYGQNASPFDTSVAPDPPSPYAASKAAATCYARMFYNAFNLPTVVLRPSVVYGPGQSPRMLIPMVMQALVENRSIDVTAGMQTRDFVFVEDTVDAIILSLTAPHIEGNVWNIGSGQVVTVRECLELIEGITGRRGLIKYGARPYANRDIFQYEPKVEETYNALGWRPSVMLAEGLRTTWQSLLKKAESGAAQVEKHED